MLKGITRTDNLKKLFLSVLLLFCLVFTYAQKARVKNDPEYDERPIHFGYTLGFNYMDFRFGRNYNPHDTGSLYSDLGQPMPGFQVGIISDYRLGEYFNLRFMPSFNFGQRNISFFQGNTLINEMKLESSMLDFPLLIKYKAKRINNYRPYLIAGGSVRYDLAAKKNYDEDLKEYILIKPLDVYVECGFGIDYYLPYFKFSTEIKFSIGLLNVLNKNKTSGTNPQYQDALTRLNSDILMFSLHFE
jgi:hypothetical protein